MDKLKYIYNTTHGKLFCKFLATTANDVLKKKYFQIKVKMTIKNLKNKHPNKLLNYKKKNESKVSMYCNLHV